MIPDFARELSVLVLEIATVQKEPTVAVPVVAAVVVQKAVVELTVVGCWEKASMPPSHRHLGWLTLQPARNPFFACGEFETPSRPSRPLQ